MSLIYRWLPSGRVAALRAHQRCWDSCVKEVSIVALPTRSAFSLRLERLRRWGSMSLTDNVDPTRGASARFTPKERLLLFAGFIFLLMLRIPEAWFFGRFMGEEGTIFLAFAWHRPASVALWRTFAGYLNLGANATTLLAVKLVRGGLLPLELAPYFTMLLALFFQIVPGALILTGRGRWLSNKWAVITCLLIIAMSASTEEVFANVLHIQFHLALCTALILVLDIPSARVERIAYLLPLLLAPLCGPGAIVILPLFALRSILDRDPDRFAQTCVLAVGSAIQMLLFYTKSPVRGNLLDPASLANLLFLRLAVMPYISAPLANYVGRVFYITHSRGGIGWWCVTAISCAYFLALVGWALRGGRDAAFWLIAIGLTIGAVSFGAGMLLVDASQWFSVGSAQRYNFLPNTMLGMGLVALVMRDDGHYRRVGKILCALTLVSGAITFFVPVKDMRGGPSWRAEVAIWRRNHDHELATWPRQWVVDLSDHDRPCTSLNLTDKGSGDPNYCEDNWLAVVRRDSLKKTGWAAKHQYLLR